MATRALIKGDRFIILPVPCLNLTLLDQGSASEAPLEASPARLLEQGSESIRLASFHAGLI